MNISGPGDRYASRYPRQGQVAILCEGDVAGYEVDLLEKWTALDVATPFTDVWACGTKTALFGVSDAIGRSIPILIIEDRDYRSPEEAATECKGKEKDRRERGVLIHRWHAWQRHEIENYLVEPAVAVPVLATFFGVDAVTVEARLRAVVECLATDQAAQWALSMFSTKLPDRSRFFVGLPRKTARPVWNPKTLRLEAPAMEHVTKALATQVKQVLDGLDKKGKSVEVDEKIHLFESKQRVWQGIDIASPIWRLDWGGKEVLTSLCRCLAGEFGWSKPVEGGREKLDWAGLAASRRDGAMDREIAQTLQPGMVGSFLEYLISNPDSDIFAEWAGIRTEVQNALKPLGQSNSEVSTA